MHAGAVLRRKAAHQVNPPLRAQRPLQALARGLDVPPLEPLPPDHPLLAAPNVLVVPHIGSATVEARAAMTERAVANLEAGLAGRPLPHPAT